MRASDGTAGGGRATQSLEAVLGAGAAGDDRGDLGDEVGLLTWSPALGEAGIEMLLGGVGNQLVAAIDIDLGLRQLVGRGIGRGVGEGNDHRLAAPERLGDVVADRLGMGAGGEQGRQRVASTMASFFMSRVSRRIRGLSGANQSGCRRG